MRENNTRIMRCQRIPHPAIACDNPSVKPDRSARSDSNPTPACDTKPWPSTVTLGRKTERLRCTFKESPLVWADPIQTVTYSQASRPLSGGHAKPPATHPHEQSRLALPSGVLEWVGMRLSGVAWR